MLLIFYSFRHQGRGIEQVCDKPFELDTKFVTSNGLLNSILQFDNVCSKVHSNALIR
jgi:hypothetical protein